MGTPVVFDATDTAANIIDTPQCCNTTHSPDRPFAFQTQHVCKGGGALRKKASKTDIVAKSRF
jgi:hypothetical protein